MKVYRLTRWFGRWLSQQQWRLTASSYVFEGERIALFDDRTVTVTELSRGGRLHMKFKTSCSSRERRLLSVTNTATCLLDRRIEHGRRSLAPASPYENPP